MKNKRYISIATRILSIVFGAFVILSLILFFIYNYYISNIAKADRDIGLWFWIISISYSIIFIISCVILYFALRKYITIPIKRIIEKADEIGRTQDLNIVHPDSYNDEIGALVRGINTARLRLLEYRNDSDDKILKRTRDLEKINQAMVGRELKMIELKNRISKLNKRKGISDENTKQD